MNRCAAVLLLTFVVASCDDNALMTPTMPSPGPLTGGSTTSRNAVASISGFVLDSGFRPLAGASVVVIDGPQTGQSTTADASGQFSFSGTFDATIRFRAAKDGYVSATQPWSCSVESCPGPNNARPWLGFYLAPVTPPVNIAGDWRLTVVADSACTDLPTELRTRTYAVTIVPTGAETPAHRFTLVARGAPLLDGYNGFSIGVAGDYLGFFLYGGHNPALTEQVGPNRYVSVSGVAAASVGTSGVSSISTLLDGWIEYCEVKSPMGSPYNCGTSNITGEPIPGAAITRVNCESRHHRLTLTRQ